MKHLIILLLLYTFISAKEYTIGFAQATLSNDWLKAQLVELEQNVKEHSNLKLIVKNGDGKISKQIRDIEEFIQMGVDFIVAMPLDTKITAIAFKKALKKGIKVILISRVASGESFTAFVGPNNYNIGKDAANLLIEKLKGKGTILMLKGVKGVSSTKERTAGFLDVIEQYPNIKVIAKTGNYLRNDAMKVMEQLYKNKVKFDAIYSQSDSMLIGARKVMDRYNIDIQSIPMVGIDYIQETKKAILNKEQFASYTYPTSAKEGVAIIIDLINNKKVPKYNYIKSKLITQKNTHLNEPIF